MFWVSLIISKVKMADNTINNDRKYAKKLSYRCFLGFRIVVVVPLPRNSVMLEILFFQ